MNQNAAAKEPHIYRLPAEASQNEQPNTVEVGSIHIVYEIHNGSVSMTRRNLHVQVTASVRFSSPDTWRGYIGSA